MGVGLESPTDMLDVVDIKTTQAQRGVVVCALYRDGRRQCDIAVEEMGAVLGCEDGIIWLGLHEPDEALLGILQAQLGLHELMIEDANQAHQRAKLDAYDNCLFIVLRTAQLQGTEIQYGETHVIIGKGFVVSIRHGASASYAEVRQRCERKPELLRLGESAIMYAILDFVGDVLRALQVADDEASVRLGARGERKSAITHHHAGDAVPAGGGAERVPEDLGVHVGVAVDETG